MRRVFSTKTTRSGGGPQPVQAARVAAASAGVRASGGLKPAAATAKHAGPAAGGSRGAPAAPAADPARIGAFSDKLLRDLKSPTALLQFFMKNAKELGEVIPASLCLARIAATWRPTDRAAVTSLKSDAMGHLLRTIAGGLTLYTGPEAAVPGAPRADPRILASIAHSLARLLPTVRDEALFSRITSAAIPRLSEFSPRSLVMFAWAASRYGISTPALYAKVCGLAVGSGEGAASQLDASELAMLATAVSAAGFSDPVVLGRLAAVAVPTLPAGETASLVSLVWAFSTAKYVHPTFFMAAGREAAVRLRRSTADASELSSFSPRALSTLLHAFAAAGVRSEDLFAAAAEHLVSVSQASGSDSGGANGYRAFGTYAGDATSSRRGRDEDDDSGGDEDDDDDDEEVDLLEASPGLQGSKDARGVSPRAIAQDGVGGKRSWPAPRAPSASGGLGDVAVISTYDTETLATVAWAFAKARYEDEGTHALWAAIQATAVHRIGVAIKRMAAAAAAAGKEGERGATGALSLPPKVAKADPLLRSSNIATLVWAASTASVSAVPLARAALHHGHLATPTYSVPALAQLLWGCAMQGSGVLHPVSSKKLFEHILTVAEVQEARAAVKAGVAKDALPSDTWLPRWKADPTDPDSLAAVLRLQLPPPPGLPTAGSTSSSGGSSSRKDAFALARKLQGQLYQGYLAATLDSSSPAAQQQAVPETVVAAWRAAYVAGGSEPTVSVLQADVTRVLRAAGVAHSPEHVTPLGLRVDVWVPEASNPASGWAVEVNGPHHYVRGAALVQSGRLPAPEAVVHKDALAAAAAAFTPASMKLRHSGPLSVGGVVDPTATARGIIAAAGIPSRPRDDDDSWIGGVEDPLAAIPGDTHSSTFGMQEALVPTLRTQAKARWLAAVGSGCRLVSIDWREWGAAESTEEKMELLAAKGLPIPSHLLP